MLICNICEGEKILINSLNETVVCPKCKGTGHIEKSIDESENNKPKQVLKG